MAKSRGRKNANAKSKPTQPWTAATARSKPPEAMPVLEAEPVSEIVPVLEAEPVSEIVPILSHRPSKDEIRARAYTIYLGRLGEPGTAIDDWLAAERQLAASA
jgi:hypothetical protein